MTSPDHELLMELLLADELSPEQQQQLREAVANGASITDEVFDQMWLDPLLRDSFRSDADAFVRRFAATPDIDDGDTREFTERLLDAWSERTISRSRRRVVGALAGTSIVLTGMFAVLFYPNGIGTTVQAAPGIQLQSAHGTVMLVNPNGQSRRVVPGVQIQPGDTISTTGESVATIEWNDGSRVILTRDTSLTWQLDQPESAFLNAGFALVNRLTTDRRNPVVLRTQHTSVQVPDGAFHVATSNLRTDVTVTRGIARMQGSDGRSVQVSGGECAIAMAQSVEIRNGSPTPDTWSEDFESGLPVNWQQGNFESADLPEGSRGAVRTALSHNEDGEPCHQIWTYSQWEHGLAVVHNDTCLNFVYRFKESDEVQILTLLRSPMPDSPGQDVQILQPSDVPENEQWWDIPSGEWYTASIPLSRLRDPVSREHPTESFVATAFNFRPQNHACGLVIDRMWLSRGTSETIEFQPLNM